MRKRRIKFHLSLMRKGPRKIHSNELDHEGFKWQTVSEGGEEETNNGNC